MVNFLLLTLSMLATLQASKHRTEDPTHTPPISSPHIPDQEECAEYDQGVDCQGSGFTVGSLSECFEYCLTSQQCKAVTFFLDERSCVLMISEYSDVKFCGKVALAKKTCLLDKSRGRLNLLQLDQERKAKSGIEIISQATQNCMKVGEKVKDKQEHSLLWTICPSEGRWHFHKMQWADEFRILSRGKPNWCLEFDAESTDVFLRHCRKNLLQRFSLKNYKEHARKFELFGNIKVENESHVIPFSKRHETKLPVVSFMVGREKARSEDSLFVPNGTVLNPNNLPFFLTGTLVTIRCDEGYEVREPGNNTASASVVTSSTVQVLVYSESVSVLPCLPVTAVQQEEEVTETDENQTVKSDANVRALETFPILCLISGWIG